MYVNVGAFVLGDGLVAGWVGVSPADAAYATFYLRNCLSPVAVVVVRSLHATYVYGLAVTVASKAAATLLQLYVIDWDADDSTISTASSVCFYEYVLYCVTPFNQFGTCLIRFIFV